MQTKILKDRQTLFGEGAMTKQGAIAIYCFMLAMGMYKLFKIGGPKALLAPNENSGGQCPSFLQAADPMVRILNNGKRRQLQDNVIIKYKLVATAVRHRRSQPLKTEGVLKTGWAFTQFHNFFAAKPSQFIKNFKKTWGA